MAALMRHGLKISHQLATKYVPVRCKNTTRAWKKGRDKKIGPRIDASAQSLAMKGFLRPQDSYTPPDNVLDKIRSLATSMLGSDKPDTNIDDAHRFQFLIACCNEFQHSIPNSLLHTIETVNDVVEFYRTPVYTVTPMETLVDQKLPENLYIRQEYHRFDPATDTMFGGKSAFPGTSTLVTGLKQKKKYKSIYPEKPWL